MILDPYKHRQTYLRWKQKSSAGIPGLTPANSALVLKFLGDMELGINVGRGSKKGARSFARLNTLHRRLTFVARKLNSHFGTCSLADVQEEDLHRVFAAMRSGVIATNKGGPYKSVADYIKVFKTFWHWHMRVQRRNGLTIPDICIDLDMSREKPKWVYLTEQDVERLSNHAKYKYRVLIRFLYDSGIRSPSELLHIRTQDLSEDCTKLYIREEGSKTFGRKINLLLSPTLLKNYIQDRALEQDDQLFPITPAVANRYLRRLAKRVLGQARSPGGEHYSRLSMYDLRHSSACYWAPRYKSESALKYRFGWKRSGMIHYYTEFLGMKDCITEDDLLIGAEKTKVERRLQKSEQEKTLLEEELKNMQTKMHEILHALRCRDAP